MKVASTSPVVLWLVLSALAHGCGGDARNDDVPARTLAGRVLDVTTRGPITGAAVRVGEREVLSDAEGR